MNTPQNPYPQQPNQGQAAPTQNFPAASQPGGSGGYGANMNQPGWGPNPQPAKKKSGKGWKILIGIVVVVALLLVLAEFGVRAFLSNQITNGVKEQAAQSDSPLASDPEVSFGSSPVLLGLATGKISHLNMHIPSSLNVTYPDSDKSKPDVKGNPEIRMQARDIKGTSQEDMRIGDLNMQTEIPTELMLAQAQEGQAKQTPQGGGLEGAIAGLMTLTGIKPDPEAGVLNFEIGGGIASLAMKPTAKDGKMTMDVEGGKVLGMNMPESFVNSIRDSLTKNAQDAMIKGMEVTDVKVTDHGMELKLHGTDVDMNELGNAGATSTQGEGNSRGAEERSERPGKPDSPYGSSGDGYGSSQAA